MSEMDDLTPTPWQGPVLPDYRSKGANPQNARAGYSNGGLTQRIPAAAAAMSRWASSFCTAPLHPWAGPTRSDQCIYLPFTNHHVKPWICFHSAPMPPPRHCEAGDSLTRSTQTAFDDKVQCRGADFHSHSQPLLNGAKLTASPRDESLGSKALSTGVK